MRTNRSDHHEALLEARSALEHVGRRLHAAGELWALRHLEEAICELDAAVGELPLERASPGDPVQRPRAGHA